MYDQNNSVSNTDKHPYEEAYRYFLIDTDGHKKYHADANKIVENRSVLSSAPIVYKNETNGLPHNKDMPDGWY